MTRRPRTRVATDPVSRSLVAAARREVEISECTWVNDAEPSALLAASRTHGVDHVLIDFLQRVSPAHQALPVLRERNEDQARFHLRALVALRNAAEALTDAGVGYVAVKGPILAGLARSMSCRAYTDLDVLVTQSQLPVALAVLENSGATLSDAVSWRSLLETEHAQVPMMLPHGVPLDLHWDLCSRPYMRRAWSVAGADELIERSGSMDTKVGAINVLSWCDMLIHTAGHAGWSGGDRLCWLVDVDSVVRSGHIDWEVVVQRTMAWGLAGIVGGVLEQARRVLASAIPAEVTEQLRGGATGSLLRTADRLGTVSGTRNPRSVRRLLYLDARSGLGTTLAAVGSRAAAATVRRVPWVDGRVGAPSTVPGSDDRSWRAPYLAFAAVGVHDTGAVS